jgi:hypothetical protein
MPAMKVMTGIRSGREERLVRMAAIAELATRQPLALESAKEGIAATIPSAVCWRRRRPEGQV